MPKQGRLFLCGTPIGNLGDISLRVLQTLEQVSLIACEDTRQTRKLLSHYNLHTPVTSYHEYNKQVRGPQLIETLLKGQDIALVSDAGMPGISDPGEELVRACLAAEIELTVVPGPAALISAVVLSGFQTRRFCFEGFPPRNKGERKAYFQQWKHEERTIVFYESPHRLLESLRVLEQVLGKRQIAICRELTKKFEEVFRGEIASAIEYFTSRGVKGEFTLVIEGVAPQRKGHDLDWAITRFQELVAQGVRSGVAVKQAAEEAQISKRELYQMVMKK